MMKLLLSCVAVWATLGAADPTWPSAIDELEDVMFLSTGYRSRGFATSVTPCSTGLALGRNTAAEWLRTAFHDMATTNTFFAPHGGIDSSLAYELNNGESIGAGFASTFNTYSSFLNSRLSASDLIALGVYASTRACGGPAVPMRGGRVDVFAAGPIGVPQPQNAIGIFNNQFSRMGFSQVEMIQVTACGHTLGGVHAGNFPNIVTPGTAPNDYQLFDNSLEFDNAIATRYISGPDTDPLAVGPSVQSTRNSDFVVFNSDKNVTLQTLTNPATFNSVCSTIFQKMIETVDPAVTLSAVIQPYEVKPAGLQLTLLAGGTQLKFSGDIRVRTTVRSASQIASVQLAYNDRTGAAVATPIIAAAGGTANGFDDSFSFYSFSSNIPVTASISSFTILVNLVGGTTETHNNNGAGYPMSDSVIVQTPQSCYSNGNLTVVAAIRTSVTTPVNGTVTQKVAATGGSPIPSPLSVLSGSSLVMVPGAVFGPYRLYSGTFSIASAAGTKYGVQSGSSSDTFKDAAGLGATCQALSANIPSSTSSTVAPSTTSSSSSPTATLGIKPTIGAYTFQGCYTEGDGVRALTGPSFFNYTAMTLDQCASNCVGYSYWGVEYGGECYCGNSLGFGSVPAAAGDCSFICPGNSAQYCGAGNRLELYRLSSLPPPSTSSISSLSSSRTSSVSGTGSTRSTSAPTSTPTLGIVKSAGLYNYYGCYTEGDGVRALGPTSFPSDTNTIEACVAACSPFLYAGAEYGRECWCADSFGAGSVLVPDSDCSMTCAGDPYEYCGAGNRLSVYIRNGTAPSVSSSASTSRPSSSSSSLRTSTSTSRSTSVSSTRLSSTSTRSSSSSRSSTSQRSSSSSSRSSSSSSRSSSRSSSSTRSSSMTTSRSSTSTRSSSTSSRSSSSTRTSSSTRSSSTSSRSSTSTRSSTSSSSAAPTQTAPAIKPVIGAYNYYGCQTEATTVRALSGATTVNYTSMTLEACASACTSFTYWGVEYGGECYCGNSFGNGSVPAPDSDCSFLCPGNSLEYCGAGNRLSTYVLR